MLDAWLAGDALGRRSRRASRPSIHRDGNVVGEGAAAPLLESGSMLDAGARISAGLSAYAICSAVRTAVQPRRARSRPRALCVRAFRAAIDEAGWLPEHVGAS